MANNINLTKLSKITNYSVSTISKALSGSKGVSKDAAETIIKAAKECGYYNSYSRKQYEKKVIALIFPEVSGEYYSGLIKKLAENISAYGASTVVSLTDFSEKTSEELVEYFSIFSRVDGIIMGEVGFSPDKNRVLDNTPVVFISPTDSKACNNTMSYKIITEKSDSKIVDYLKNKGHKNIGYIGENHTQNRCRALIERLKEESMPFTPDYFVSSDERFEKAGIQGMKRLLEANKLPDAVVCAYDKIAFGAMKAVHDAGLNIPEDISVIGINDIDSSAYTLVPLTSYNPNREFICKRAIEILFDMISGIIPDRDSEFVEGYITERCSVKSKK